MPFRATTVWGRNWGSARLNSIAHRQKESTAKGKKSKEPALIPRNLRLMEKKERPATPRQGRNVNAAPSSGGRGSPARRKEKTPAAALARGKREREREKSDISALQRKGKEEGPAGVVGEEPTDMSTARGTREADSQGFHQKRKKIIWKTGKGGVSWTRRRKKKAALEKSNGGDWGTQRPPFLNYRQEGSRRKNLPDSVTLALKARHPRLTKAPSAWSRRKEFSNYTEGEIR